MVAVALLCLLGILTLTQCWVVARVLRLSKLALLATRKEKAPQRWESSLQEVRADLVSLSSNYEKVSKAMLRLNSRAGMRELRDERAHAPPPVGASKGELRRYYGLNTDGPEFARRQLQLVPSTDKE